MATRKAQAASAVVDEKEEKKAAKKARKNAAAKALKSLKLPAELAITIPKEYGGGTITLKPLASKHGSVGYYGNGKLFIGDHELTLGLQSWVKHSKEMDLGIDAE